MSQPLTLASAAGAAAAALVLYRLYKWRQGRFICMSYNILIETKTYPGREDSDWPNRKDLLIKQIRDRRAPDLLGMQECGPNQVQELREALSGYHLQHLFRELPGEEAEGLMLAVNPATMEVGESGHFWLATEKPHVVGSKAPGAEHPRVAMWVACRLRGHGGRILFVNFHLDHPTTEQGELNRQQGARQIVAFTSEPRWAGHEVILVGDSNGEPGALAYNGFMGSGRLVDSWAECNQEAAKTGAKRPPTFHNYEGASFEPPKKWAETAWPKSLTPGASHKSCHIDWMLHTRGLQAEKFEIDHTEESGCLPSDHFAVWSVLRMRA